MAHALGVVLAQRELDLRLQAADRRLELVGGIGHEAVLEVEGACPGAP
jgi:hypothetical protein